MTTITPEQAAAMDDMGAHSQLVSEADLERLIADKCASGCRGNCHQGRQPCEWASPHRLHDWTEVLPETCETKPRLGPLTGIERRLLHRRPTYTWAAITMLAVVCAVKWVVA